MFPDCEGLGQVSDIDLTQIVDESLSLNDGAILVPGTPPTAGWCGSSPRRASSTATHPCATSPPSSGRSFLYGEQQKVKIASSNMTYEGLVPKITKSMLQKDRDGLQPHIRAFVDRAVTFVPCPACGGTRLNEGARSSRIDGVNIADAAAMQITVISPRGCARSTTPRWRRSSTASVTRSTPSSTSASATCRSTARAEPSPAGGAAHQDDPSPRSSLTDITYVFDEPTAGLHPHDIQRMNDTLRQLRDKANTELVVEQQARGHRDRRPRVDLGPRAGRDGGGTIQYEGDVAGLRGSDTLTGASSITAPS